MTGLTNTIHPERLRTVEEVETVISDLDRLAEEKGADKEDCGVALLQNFQLGGSYHAVTKARYESKKHGCGEPEFYCKYWPRAYFEALREKLSRAE